MHPSIDHPRRKDPRGWPGASARVLASAIAIAASLLPAAAFPESRTAAAEDGFPTAPLLYIMPELAFQNILGGAGLELDLALPAKWMAKARASYSFDFMDGSMSLGPLGMDGLKAQLGFDAALKSSSGSRQVFRKLVKVSETSSTETWFGYYYEEPYHSAHMIGLDLMLESTGAFAPGYASDSMVPVWSIEPAYSLYLFPHYRYYLGTDYLIPDPDSKPTKEKSRADLYLSVGPLFCPDFSQYGGAFDCFMLANFGQVEVVMSAMLGVVLVDQVPSGDYNAELEETAGAIDGFYMPYRLSFGVNIPVSFGKKEGK